MNYLDNIILPIELRNVVDKCPGTMIPDSRGELLSLAMGGDDNDFFEVSYDVEGRGSVVEATVARCKNGLAVNYVEPYMRRRDPQCMVIADEKDTDKPKYDDKFGFSFDELREASFAWLSEQRLILMPFMSGGKELGYPALLVAPDNAGFFAGGLADLQGMLPGSELTPGFKPKVIIYLAPTFRHTHFDGKQMVVHNRISDMHELFSYNLYPGPSAKKGVYGALLNIGEEEGWVTVHGSTVKVITPYDNELVIMHEGASGGGKSEMIEYAHMDSNGKALLGENSVTNEKRYLELKETCELKPVTDDMALCHPDIQNGSKRLRVTDAEQGWFLRINHITEYGTDPQHEKLCIHPKEPLIFLNLQGVPGSTCLIWEHTMDEPDKPCPNPRVIMPRQFVPNVVNDHVEIDVRSFGIRTPLCTKEKPTYGIIGFFHILPPSLAWLWRLVAPRGHDNPSITDTVGMTSEGVGSYWPFATGKRVTQANLLLKQIVDTSSTRFVLIPNQNVGAYKVGFMPQWIAREYLARRGSARFASNQIVESKCPLLGYALESLKIDGTFLSKGFLQVNRQSDVGDEAYEEGANILTDFFKRELAKFMTPDLDNLGKQIIDCCMSNGTLKEYVDLLPMHL